MFGCAPLKEKLVRLNIDFLEDAVENPPILRSADNTQVRGPGFIYSKNSRLVRCDVKLMQVCRKAVDTADFVRFFVAGIELVIIKLADKLGGPCSLLTM
jgi:hypothetical protein